MPSLLKHIQLWKEKRRSSHLSARGSSLQIVDTESARTPREQSAGTGSIPYDRLWLKAVEVLQQGTAEQRACADTVLGFKSEVSSKSANSLSTGDGLIQALLTECEAREQEASDTSWEVRFGAKTWIIRDTVKDIIEWLNKFKEIGDVAVSFDPTHAALPWAAFRFVLQAATIRTQQAAELLIGLQRIAKICLRCRLYGKIYLGGDQSTSTAHALETATIDLFSRILHYLSLAVQEIKSTRKLHNAVTGVLRPSKFLSVLTVIECQEREVELAATNCHLQLNRESYSKVEDIYQFLTEVFGESLIELDDKVSNIWASIDQQEKVYLLRWISDIPYQSDFENVSATRHKDTCEWLIVNSIYLQWWNSWDSSCLWLHGIPGAGKTKLTSKVVQTVLNSTYTASEHEAVAYFFCDRGREDRRDPLSILASLVRQLSVSRKRNDIASFTQAKYQEKQQGAFASNALTIDECESLLLQLCGSYKRTIILIDGLDECDQRTRHALFEVLENILTKCLRTVKLFVSSRDDDDIKARYCVTDNLSIQADHNQDDIEHYVSDRMEKTQWCRETMSAEVKSQVFDTFRAKSQGMFQWAVLHINDLLELKSDKLVSDYLHHLPEGLAQTYGQLYRGIDKRKIHIANRAFQWMICSWRPLTSEELEIAVSQDPDLPFNPQIDYSISLILETCRNLIVLLPERSKDGKEQRLLCKFAHLSVLEYLETAIWTPSVANNFVLRIHLQFLLGNHLGNAKISSLWKSRMRSWDRQCVAFEGRVLPDTLDLMMKFIGRPHDSTLLYREWASDMGGPQTERFESELSPDLKTILEKGFPHSQPYARPVFQARYHYVAGAYASDGGELWKKAWVSCLTLGLHDVLHKWLEGGFLDPNSRDINSHTAIGLSIMTGRPDICETFLEFGASANLPTGGFASPLQAGVVKGAKTLEFLRALHAKGADPNVAGGYFGTPLQLAAVEGSVPAIRFLLEIGADVNQVAGVYGTALQAAVAQSRLDICKVLLDAGAEVNVMAGRNGAALFEALSQCDVAVSRFLLGEGARADITNPRGETALHVAVSWGDAGLLLAQLLVEYGANVNGTSSMDETPLQAAISLRNPALNLVQCLIQLGATWDEEDVLHRDPGSDVLRVLGLEVDDSDGSDAESFVSTMTYLPQSQRMRLTRNRVEEDDK